MEYQFFATFEIFKAMDHIIFLITNRKNIKFQIKKY